MERLRQLRRARGLTQSELAKKAGLQQRTISDLEVGRSETPRPSTLRKLAGALDVDVAELVGEPLPKDGAAQTRPERHEKIRVPESMRALLWDRLSMLPLIPLRHETFVEVFESADTDEERQRLLDQVRRERTEVLRYADEAEAKAAAGARVSPVAMEKLTIWREASRRAELVARELTRSKVGA